MFSSSNHDGLFINLLGGAFEGVEDKVSPFGYKRGEGADAGKGEPEWIVNKERYKYDQIFESLGPIDGKLTGAGNILTTKKNFIFITIAF